jgi:WD40 repeat protein
MARITLALVLAAAGPAWAGPPVVVRTAPGPADPLPPGCVGQYGDPRLRHGEPIDHLAWSPDGKILASVSNRTGEIKFWNAATGRLISRTNLLSGKDGDLFAACSFTADGAFIAAIHPDGEKPVFVRLDPATGREYRRAPIPDLLAAKAGVFSPDGSRFATVEGTSLYVFDTASGRPVQTQMVLQAKARGLAFSADGRLLAVAESRGVAVRDAKTGGLVHFIGTDVNAVQRVAFTPDGTAQMLDVGDEYPTLIDLAIGLNRWAKDKPGGKFGEDSILVFVGKDRGKLGATGMAVTRRGLVRVRNQELELLDWQTGRPVPKWSFDIGSNVRVFAASPDGSYLAVESGDGLIRLWGLSAGRECPQSAGRDVLRGEFRDSGTGRIILQSSNERFVRWAYANSAQRETLSPNPSWFKTCDTNADGSLLVCSDAASFEGRTPFLVCGMAPAIQPPPPAVRKYQSLYLYAPATGDITGLYQLDGNTEVMPVFAGGGRWVVATDVKQRVYSWDTTRPNANPKIAVVCEKDEKLTALIPARDAATVVCDITRTRDEGEQRFLAFVDAATGMMVGRVPVESDTVATKVAVSADGRRVVTLGPESTNVFRLVTKLESVLTVYAAPGGRVVRRIPLTSWGPLTVSPDGRVVAVKMTGTDFALYEIATGRERVRFTVPHFSSAPDSAAFRVDGSELLVSTDIYPLTAWDVRGTRSCADPLPADYSAARAWADLADHDAKVGFRAMRYFAARPAEAAATFRAKIPPAATVDMAQVRNIAVGWNDESFAEREKTSRELRPFAGSARAVFEGLAARDPSAEVRARAARLLSDANTYTPDELRAVRAVEVLDWVDTPEGKALVAVWAAGAAGDVLTVEAEASQKRPKR